MVAGIKTTSFQKYYPLLPGRGRQGFWVWNRRSNSEKSESSQKQKNGGKERQGSKIEEGLSIRPKNFPTAWQQFRISQRGWA